MADNTRVADAAAVGNAPLYMGEWSLTVNWENNATDSFLRKWGDAQKKEAATGAGWTFWAWKASIYQRRKMLIFTGGNRWPRMGTPVDIPKRSTRRFASPQGRPILQP